MRLRAHLVTLVLAAAVPVVIFSIIMVVLFARQERDAMARGLSETARALVVALDRDLTMAISSLEALAASEHLDTPDLAAFHRHAHRVLPTQQAWESVFLAEPSGRLLVNTLRPLDAPLHSAADHAYFKDVLATRRPVISDLREGRVAGAPMITIAVPVMREGRLRYVVGAGFSLRALAAIFAQQNLPADWTGAILDRDRVILARSRAPEPFIGQPATPVLAQRSRESTEGVFEDSTKDGIATYGVFSRSPLSG
ncbi:MAG: cache domain-containing protein, partial [Candidatus Rokuibacteriota bacterium]